MTAEGLTYTKPNSEPISDLGESAMLVTLNQSPPGNEDSPVLYKLAFNRGCWYVFVNAGGLMTNFIQKGGESQWAAEKAWARQVASDIDGKIRGGPQCPEGTVTPPTTTQGGDLGVTVTCQTNFEDPMLAICTAVPANERSDAQLVYEWKFDGSEQSASGTELRLAAVRPGDHSVTVTARDTVNNLTSSPQTVSFTKAETPPGGGGGGDGGGGIPGIPWVPVGIGIAGIGLIGVVGTVVSKPRKPPPRPATPPERLTQPAPPPPEPAPQQPKVGDIWLEVDRRTIEVHANGETEVPVRVTAKKLVDGVTVDATNEVTTTTTLTVPSNPPAARKITITRLPPLGFAVSARHAGVTPIRAKVIVSAVSATGQPVAPVDVEVTIKPVRIEVRIKVKKLGFLEQEVVATLPYMCERVVGRVLGPDQSPRPQDASRGGEMVGVLRGKTPKANTPESDRHVAHARLEAHLQVDDHDPGRSIEKKVNDDGTFSFRMSAAMIAVYGAEVTTYDLPQDVELGLDADTNRALYYYNVAVDDYGRELADASADSAIQDTFQACTDYADEVLEQLREHEESDYKYEISALQRMRAAILFALKYRKDLKRQRKLVEMATYDSFGSLIDVLTDILPVAAWIQKWFGGEQITWRFGRYYVTLLPLREIIEVIEKIETKSRLLRILGYALLASLRSAEALGKLIETLVAGLLGLAAAMARKAGLPLQYVENIARWSMGGPDVAGPIQAETPPGTKALKLVARLFVTLFEAAIRATACACHVILIAVAVAWMLVGKAIKALDWGPVIEGFEETVGEIIEKYLGDFANWVYNGVGSVLDSLLGGWLLPRDPARPRKDACDILLDKIASLDDLDAKCAPALGEALRRSRELDVYEDWESAIHSVAKQENEEDATWQELDTATEFLDSTAPFLKLFAKFVQAVLFAWAALGAGVVGIPLFIYKVLSEEGVAPKPAVWSPTDALDFASAIEKVVDAVDFVVVRMPILLKESVALACVYNLAPIRIQRLYQV